MPIGKGAAYANSCLHFTTNVTSSSTEYWYDMPHEQHQHRGWWSAFAAACPGIQMTVV